MSYDTLKFMNLSEVSLYNISLKRVKFLLMKQTWMRCSVNPFSNLPSEIIDDVMELVKYESISLIHPLLTSGSLTRLQFFSQNLQEEGDLFQEIIQTNCFKFLRHLHWYSGEDGTIPLLETLLPSCPRLEEFHSCQIVNLDAFQNCKELKVLKICVPHDRPVIELSGINLDFSALTSLRNLQNVSFINVMDNNMIANILKHCPHLISIGCFDTLKGLEQIHADIAGNGDTDCSEVSAQFQLKKCLWGYRIAKLNRMAIDDVILYKSSFSERIKIAVSLCPFVEELVICISDADSIEYLKNLKQLICLKISFLECDNDCMANFIALLKIIGPKLMYLSVNSRHPVPVDIVCDCCPRLQSFEVVNIGIATGSVQPGYNVVMKRLRIKTIDENALLFLLFSCRGLVELSLCDASCLNDNVLDQILRLNPLAQLKICDITTCSLSKRGFRMFLEKAVSLERVKFASFRRDIAYIVEKLIKKLNLPNVTYGELFDLPIDELGGNF